MRFAGKGLQRGSYLHLPCLSAASDLRDAAHRHRGVWLRVLRFCLLSALVCSAPAREAACSMLAAGRAAPDSRQARQSQISGSEQKHANSAPVAKRAASRAQRRCYEVRCSPQSRYETPVPCKAAVRDWARAPPRALVSAPRYTRRNSPPGARSTERRRGTPAKGLLTEFWCESVTLGVARLPSPTWWAGCCNPTVTDPDPSPPEFCSV